MAQYPLLEHYKKYWWPHQYFFILDYTRMPREAQNIMCFATHSFWSKEELAGFILYYEQPSFHMMMMKEIF